MPEWWFSPLSGAVSHEIAPWAYWLARCMVLAWGVLLPLGAIVARFYKVMPGQNWPRELDNARWWHGHRRLQWAGVGVMTLGLWLAWNHAAEAGGGVGISTRAFVSTTAQAHAWAGWALCAVAWLQIAGGLARGSKGGPTDVQMRGDHYDMTPRRTSFERAHKALGWLAVGASMVVIALGLVVADAPRWMALVLALWWLVLAAVCAVLQQSGRCIDTYQAIWGPDPIHPGNRMSPVGWGVRRPLG